MDNMFDDIAKDQVSSMVQKALHGSDDGELFLQDVEEALYFPIKTKRGDNYNALQ